MSVCLRYSMEYTHAKSYWNPFDGTDTMFYSTKISNFTIVHVMRLLHAKDNTLSWNSLQSNIHMWNRRLAKRFQPAQYTKYKLSNDGHLNTSYPDI